VLNYCMFSCDFTLMMLTPLWTSQLTLYVGQPAFAARLSLSTGIITFIHFAVLFNRKNNTNTL